jgi:hypothetical protein
MQENSRSKNDKATYRYTSNQRNVETKARKFKKLRNELKPEDVQECEDTLSKFAASTVSVSKFSDYLKTREEVEHTLRSYYANENTAHDDENLLPFRKMKLSSIINRKQSDSRLSINLRKKFGNDAILVLGDWSSGNAKFHEPIRGVGMRRTLRKHGFQVYLINEFKTSSVCPSCKQDALKNFKWIQNPRPFRRKKTPKVLCHGLLR